MPDSQYVIITAAHNEAPYIGATIESVLTQSALPALWIIANDRSIDGTADIVRFHAEAASFIKLIEVHSNCTGRDFASKANALNAALRTFSLDRFNFLGILDADVSIPSNYYGTLIGRFLSIPSLGLAGGMILDRRDHRYAPRAFEGIHSVAGAIQLFRKECFIQIGQFPPLRHGFEDTVVQIMARMNGWQTMTFNDLPVLHHRPTGMGAPGFLRACLDSGRAEYSVGYGMFYSLAKSLRRIFERPPLLGATCHLVGYLASMLTRQRRCVPPDFVRYLRLEQRSRIYDFFTLGHYSKRSRP
ncbi:MAG: glycosyltransferase [Acidobacteriia bacterium]|nr:glycosyltransferase [Terriglobia bacterium]